MIGESQGTASSATAAPPVRSLGANLASLATSQLITWTLTLLWTFIVPRLLGPGDIGLMVIATSLATLITVVFTGATREFLVREMVSDRPAAASLLGAAIWTRAAAIPVAFVAAAVYGRATGMDGRAMTVMYLTTAAIGLALLTDAVMSMFQAFERMQYIAYSNVGTKSLSTLGGVVLALSGFGIVAISSFGVLVAAVAFGLALWWARTHVDLTARPAAIRPLLRRGRPYWVVSIFTMTYIWIDGFMLGIMVPTEVVGWYGAATRLFTTMSFVAIIISTASLPRMISAFAESSERMFAIARQSLEWVLICAFPLGIGMACVSDSLVPFIFGDEYRGSVVPLMLLTVGLPLTYSNIIANQVFIATGRPQMIARLLTLALVFNVALNLALIPMFQERWGNGATAAALSLLLTELLQTVACLFLIGRQLLVRSTIRRIAVTATATAGMAAVVGLADDTALAVQVLCGAISFVGLAVILRLPTAAEAAVFKAQMQRLGRRLPARSR